MSFMFLHSLLLVQAVAQHSSIGEIYQSNFAHSQHSFQVDDVPAQGVFQSSDDVLSRFDAHVLGMSRLDALNDHSSLDISSGSKFNGLNTFANLPYVHCLNKSQAIEAYDIAILGAPFDTVGAPLICSTPADAPARRICA